MLTNEEAVNARISRRRYDTTPIDAESVDILMRLIDNYRMMSGLDLRLVLNDGEAFAGFRRNYGLLSGVENFFLLAGNPSDKDSFEKAGYFGECLVLESTKLGLGTCWVGGSFSKKICRSMVKNVSELICVIVVGNVKEDKDLKEKMIARIAHFRKSKTIEEMCSGEKPYPDWFLHAMEFVKKAPSAQNRQPVHFIYKNESVTASVKNPSGLYLVDLGIAKLHFELGADGGWWQWGNNGKFIMDQIA